MGVVGAIALTANLVCFILLYRHRGDNLNMSSTWLCSRNDLIANVGVLLAAGITFWVVSRWPDIIVGCVIAALFLHSAYGVLHDAIVALRQPHRLQGPAHLNAQPAAIVEAQPATRSPR